jgi:hypothetical protein
MEAARTSERLVKIYQTTRRNNPEDSHLHTRRRENLKSNLTNRFVTTILGTYMQTLKVAVRWLSILLRIFEIPDSNLVQGRLC